MSVRSHPVGWLAERDVDAIDNLFEDHRHIMAVLDVLDVAVIAALNGQLHLPVFERGLAFISTFADGAHYAKEERLFAACVVHAVPCAAGPVQCLRMEHEGSKAQTDRMARAIQQIRAGDVAHWATLLDASARYSAIVRMHIPKENLGFFPMSQMMLSTEVRATLAQEFERIDSAGSIAAAAAGVRRAAVVAAADRKSGGRRVSHADMYRLEDPRLPGILREIHEAPDASAVLGTRGQRGNSRLR